MDLLDLLKLMFRRWYVTVPVLLGTVAGALALGNSIQPEYKTSAAVLLVPPTTATAGPAPGASPQPGNPWLRVGENAMAQAVQISVSSHDYRRRVATAGGTAPYEVGLVNRSSILTIDVTATSTASALATVTAVTRLIKDEVAARQAGYRPRPGEQITTEILDPGLNVTQSRSNVFRAQIVVGAVGLLVAAVLAVVTDALLRRRKLRLARRGRTGGGSSGQAAVPRRPRTTPAARRPSSSAPATIEPPEPVPVADRSSSGTPGVAESDAPAGPAVEATPGGAPTTAGAPGGGPAVREPQVTRTHPAAPPVVPAGRPVGPGGEGARRSQLDDTVLLALRPVSDESGR